MEALLDFDTWLFYAINHGLSNSLFDRFFPFITEVRHWIMLYIAGFVVLFWKGGRRGILIGIAIILTIAITDQLNSSFLKEFIGRIRPCHVLPDVNLLVNCGGGKSFPSSHAANNFALAYILSVFFFRHRFLFFTIAFLMAFSRVYTGVHYPFDAVGGAFVGLGVGMLVSMPALALDRKLFPGGFQNAVIDSKDPTGK